MRVPLDTSRSKPQSAYPRQGQGDAYDYANLVLFALANGVTDREEGAGETPLP